MLILALRSSVCFAACATCSPAENRPTAGRPADLRPYPRAFSELEAWDDGLSEMCYYDAVDSVYGKPRRYIRIMLLNREWLRQDTRVKAEEPNPETDMPVFKLNIVEEIPTENYNYRHMITVFLDRGSLEPVKLVASSQEWCGTSFKQMHWLPGGLRIRGFSYFEGEADKTWNLPPAPVIYPHESVYILARAACAAMHDMDLLLLPPMRTNHLPDPTPEPMALRVREDLRRIRVPAGHFASRPVSLIDRNEEELLRMYVEAQPPYRLLKAESPAGLQLTLRFVERRAYWDRTVPSRFYQQGRAP